MKTPLSVRRALLRGLAGSSAWLAMQGVATAAAASGKASSDTPASRIVCVGSDLTEIVYALGAGDRVVGTDTTSQWPVEVERTHRVGYLRNLSAEGILSLSPDLLLASSGAGPDTTIAQLTQAGLRIVRGPEAFTLDAAREKIDIVGLALLRQAQAESLRARFEQDVTALEAARQASRAGPRVVFMLGARNGSPQVAGRDSAADAVIALVGAHNPFTHRGYKAVSPEALAESAPDWILTMPHSLEAVGGIEGMQSMPAIAMTPAGRSGRILSVDGSALLSFGPRTPASALALLRHLDVGPR